jgi:xanthine dehydrogenase accessory factor
MKNPIQILAEAIDQQETAVLATVIEVQGASPAKVGAQMVLCSDGGTAGTVGGGKLEESILADAKQSLETNEAQVRHYKLAETGPDAIGTLCGGEVRVFFQPYCPHPRLVIVGGGHIGRPLKVMGEAAGFNVITVDVQPGRADIPSLEQLDFQREAYVVLITTDHISDEAALRYVLTTPTQYIGMIGSRAKCHKILDRLQLDGYAEETLHRVYAPIGLDLGGSTPEEIAVAILAEIIAVRRGKLGEHETRIGLRKEPFIHSTIEEKLPAMDTKVNHEN